MQKKSVSICRENSEEFMSHGVGDISLFAVNEGFTTYLDESLKRFETVSPAGVASIGLMPFDY